MVRKSFLTGCDYNTEWQLPWFIENFLEHSVGILQIADFGMSTDMLDLIEHHPRFGKQIYILSLSYDNKMSGWFKKPQAIYEATRDGFSICWLDTDCQIDGDIDSIWSHFEPGRIGMVVDRPWTKRRPDNGEWYNSGVVLSDRNQTLTNWMGSCAQNQTECDQHVLYYMHTPIERIGKIYPIPHEYNTLRLDYIDNVAVDNPIVIHHTGKQGNDVIRQQMNL
jgi:hypothetical protein